MGEAKNIYFTCLNFRIKEQFLVRNMSLNKYMHPRNPYRHKEPNFKSLAVEYEFFRQFVSTSLSGKCLLDFKQPEALRALLKAVMTEDFGIELDMPVDRLIPTLPLRINYLLWIEDLLKLFRPGVPPNDFLGIDVGAGAPCIYAILGSKFFGWNFLSLEVDDVSLTFAQANLTANDLQSRVRLSRVSPDEPFHEVLARCLGPDDAVRVPFVVCNPPFFADDAELREGTTRKDESPQPWSVSSASSVESVTIGGEVGFVRRIIESSLLIRDRIAVYTTMLGKQSSISPLKIFLKSHLISHRHLRILSRSHHALGTMLDRASARECLLLGLLVHDSGFRASALHIPLSRRFPLFLHFLSDFSISRGEEKRQAFQIHRS